jgi:hypothetical protein
MDAKPRQTGERGSNTGRLVGATSNIEIISTQHGHRYKLVHPNGANAATNYMTQDAHLKIIRKTASRKDWKQLEVGCESIHIEAIGGQWTV